MARSSMGTCRHVAVDQMSSPSRGEQFQDVRSGFIGVAESVAMSSSMA
jgi:hypothetical protein